MSGPGGVWRHVKRGTEYVVFGDGEVQSSAGGIQEGQTARMYIGTDDGKSWVREVSEFEDGRFEKILGIEDDQVVEALAGALLQVAAHRGLVVTIEQVPREPLRMGNYDSVVSVRRVDRKEG